MVGFCVFLSREKIRKGPERKMRAMIASYIWIHAYLPGHIKTARCGGVFSN